LWIVAPLATVIVLAAAWSGLWFYASRVADATIAAWIEREAALGRLYACGTRRIAGYPFRIELRCSEPSLELRAAGVSTVLKAQEVLAVAQVYQPDLVIAEVTGPLTIGEAGSAPALIADWTLLQASVRGAPKTPERISLVLSGPQLRRAGAAAPDWRADRLELHVRQSPGAATPAFELAADVAGAGLAWAPTLQPLNAQAAAILSGVSDLRPKPASVWLREWQAAGGRLELTSARVQRGESSATGRGDIGLNAGGRLDGTVTVTLTGFDDVLRLLLPNLQIRGAPAGLLGGLANVFGGKARALTIPLRFTDGAVFFGPLPLGHMGPAY
jgi:hypothetical protein